MKSYDELKIFTLNLWRCEMKSYDELKAEMEVLQQQMVEAKKNESANALKEVKRLYKEFGFTAGMLKGSLAEGRKVKQQYCLIVQKIILTFYLRCLHK